MFFHLNFYLAHKNWTWCFHACVCCIMSNQGGFIYHSNSSSFLFQRNLCHVIIFPVYCTTQHQNQEVLSKNLVAIEAALSCLPSLPDLWYPPRDSHLDEAQLFLFHIWMRYLAFCVLLISLQVPSTLLQMTGSRLFMAQHCFIMRIYHIALSGHQLMDTWASISWIVWLELL